MSTLNERRIAFLIEEEPGIYKFHVQRGEVNAAGDVDLGVSHLHAEQYTKGNCVLVSTGTAGNVGQASVQLTPGTVLARGAGDIESYNSQQSGTILGWTRGGTFPATPLTGVLHRHWLQDAELEEPFIWDTTRSKWLSERTVTLTFAATGAVTNDYLFMPNAGRSRDDYGYTDNYPLTIVGVRVTEGSTAALTHTLTLRQDGIVAVTWNLPTNKKFTKNVTNVDIPTNAYISAYMNGTCGVNITVNVICRRTGV